MELLVNHIRMIVKPFGPGIDCGGEIAMLAAELAEVLEDTTFDPFSDTSKLTRQH